MKKLIFIAVLFLLVAGFRAQAQERTMQIYKGNTVVAEYKVSEIDSVKFETTPEGIGAQAQDRTMQIYKGNTVVAEYKVSEIDSVKFETTPEEVGVEINGVTWATRNVDAPGTFAATPESAGMFYQWNRRIGWSSTDPMVNSNGGTTWDSSTPGGTEWEKENDPCPEGWRVPTTTEQRSLIDAGSSWTTQNGVKGRIFGSGSNTLFLPVAGCRGSYGGSLYSTDMGSYCWSSTQSDSSNAYYLAFSSVSAFTYNAYRNYGYLVRCVKTE